MFSMADPESPLLIKISLLLRKLKTQEVRHSITSNSKKKQNQKESKQKKVCIINAFHKT